MLVSIVVPVYNVEKYLNRCISSIVNQTYENIEIILVDDGSKDNSGEICDEWAEKDTRIKVIHKSNGGLSSARNAGASVAQGEYISFIDSDDYIRPIMIKDLVLCCEKYNADIGIANVKQIYRNFESVMPDQEVYCCSGEKAVEHLFYGNGKYFFSNAVWNRLYKKEIIKDLKFPEGRNYEDICYTVEAFLKAKNVVCTGKTGYIYVVERTDSIMNAPMKEKHAMDATLNCEERDYVLQQYGNKRLRIAGTYDWIKQMTLEFYRIYESDSISDKKKYYTKIYKKMMNISSNNQNPFGLKTRGFICGVVLWFMPDISAKCIEYKLKNIRNRREKKKLLNHPVIVHYDSDESGW